MLRLISSMIFVCLIGCAFGQCNPMCDSTNVSISERALLTQEIFHEHVMKGWTKIKQNTLNQKLGIGAFNMSKVINNRNIRMATTSDSSKYIYCIQAFGFKTDSSNATLKPIALNGDITFQISDNLFEISVTSWDWDLNERYIYGYLDSKNYLFIGTSKFRIELNELDLNTVSWTKYFQSGYSIFNP